MARHILEPLGCTPPTHMDLLTDFSLGSPSPKALLVRPLLGRDKHFQGSRGCAAVCVDFFYVAKQCFFSTTDAAFIRSEVNGRRSRRAVLLAFFVTDVIGAILWACWCEKFWDIPASASVNITDQPAACGFFGMNHFFVLLFGMPAEGAVLYLAGNNPWSFWSDGLLLPVWLIRLGLFDVLLWHVSPQMLLGDALWFSVMAVMSRVHSLALLILVASQIASLCVVLRWQRELRSHSNDFDMVHNGVYSVAMLIVMACAYFVDEQSRLQSYLQFMSLQDQNAALASSLLRWKVLPAEQPHCASAAAEFQPDDRGVRRVPSSVCHEYRKSGGHRAARKSGGVNEGQNETTDAPSLPSSSSSSLPELHQPEPSRETTTFLHSGGGKRTVLTPVPEAARGGRAIAPTRRPQSLRQTQACTTSNCELPLDLLDVIE